MRGGSIVGVLGELLGRQIGMSNGKGGSMHIFTPSFFGGNGIVGAQVPVGAGIAFAQKYMDKKVATYAMYGDGASNQGQVFEAFNMVSSHSIKYTYRYPDIITGETLEPPMCFRVREQQVWYGYLR